MITSSPLYQRLMKFPPLVRRFVIGLVFYLVWFFDMKYFAYTALGPWIAGITLVIFFWAWGFWVLVYIFIRALFVFLRIYLIYLR